jgi:hypothetical protein
MCTSAIVALKNASVLYDLPEKNTQAENIIKDYAAKHAAMDIGVGLISLIPGAAIPAILGALALQSRRIYRPMAQDLAAVYLKDTDHYTDRLGNIATVTTVGMEFAQEFALEFLTEHARELITDAGLGIAASCIPFAGAALGAGLDYVIAQMMTWRVGTMTSIYFQNGGQWIGDRRSTMEIAKELTGGLHLGVIEATPSRTGINEDAKDARVDLDSIPSRVPEVLRSAARTILPLIKGFAEKLPKGSVRESLLSMGIPAIMVDAAMQEFYA